MENNFANAYSGKITARHFFRPLRTGGPLNRINEIYGLNKPELSVPVMKLVQSHKPSSEQEMIKLLQSHLHPCNACDCRVVQGGLPMWSQRLYDVAKPSYPAVTQDECRAFVYDLYVRAPLRGRLMELKALSDLGCEFPRLRFEEASSTNDLRFAVDIECYSATNNLLAGVQVKPVSFLKQAHAVEINYLKNKAWMHPVFYLYYNSEANFTSQSWNATKQSIQNLLEPPAEDDGGGWILVK